MSFSPIYRMLPWMLLIALGAACSPRLLDKPYDTDRIKRIYAEAVGDAAKPQPWEQTDKLQSITNENPELVWRDIDGEPYVLVTTWKKDTIYYRNDPQTKRYNTGSYPIWVTVVPELQQVCKEPRFGRREGLSLRLKQLFGLPPTGEYHYFVEFWVRPVDLFRPCPDPEITDQSCELAFPDGISSTHQDWVNQLRLNSYFHAEWDENYPWTALGYTYDWNIRNKDHIGLSEFVIGKQRDIIVHRVYTTEAYCEPNAKETN